MDKIKRKVVVGLLGSRLDSGVKSERWGSWRPSVALCQQEDLLVDRFELLSLPSNSTVGQQLVEDINSTSPETEVRLHPINISDPWDFELAYAALHDFARNYSFDLDSEEYLVHITTGTHVTQICLFLLAESRHLPGKLLQTIPPKRSEKGHSQGDYRIIDLDLSKYDRLATRFQREHQQGTSFLKSGIETRNKSFNSLIDMIERVAINSVDPILLLGPTGAGKSKLARRIYELKHHRQQVAGRFVELNCATIRGDQAMSALFGHIAGAFTGATSDRPGLLFSAQDGMLFLDEIGELGADEQAMLLRAIEEGRFLPVGADEESSSDFQLIAGTNRDLSAEVEKGTFREDLLARLNLWTFRLPGLAERSEDIEPNLQYELDELVARTGRKVTFNKESRERFLDFACSAEGIWKANFRDLGGAITRMATLSHNCRINIAVVEEEIARLRESWSATSENNAESTLLEIMPVDDIATLDRFDKVQLAEVVRVCRSSPTISKAGRELFSQSRLKKQKPNDADRLRKYLARFGLQWSDVSGQ